MFEENIKMKTVELDLEDDLVGLILQLDQPLHKSIRELIVLELYRQAKISSGKAGQLLDMNRFEFIRYASRLGIPYFDMTKDEWETEKNLLQNL
jgi:predicted HTH domain antitoxin